MDPNLTFPGVSPSPRFLSFKLAAEPWFWETTGWHLLKKTWRPQPSQTMSGKPKPHPVYPVYPAWRSRIPWENGRKRTGPVLSVWELLFATKPKWYLLKAGYHTHKSEVWKPIESEMDSRVCLLYDLCANFTFNILPGVTRPAVFLAKTPETWSLENDPFPFKKIPHLYRRKFSPR